ncbi:type VI secretion system Vgr family protein [Janthinobacterium sp. SUN176]|uniref:type VI secretion system Vgr family protein n=1 Tax=Janthinobacterium sp. SUN176 TaxID=3014788 RepID=UPI0027136C72|nr:type VI secretion system Vgr family protein [Janthinobacterium sp. SUN176]MDO8071970.1 type VI secretion system Vgr family protein [Janthinobacterium sp. SUN176]
MHASIQAALSAIDLAAQDRRLLKIEFPHEDGPAGAILLVNSLTAREEVSRDFRFEAELLSDDAHIALKAMMGRMVTISMVRDDGTLRHFNGYVGEFCLLRADGGFAWYRMVLQSWLAFARLRQDNVSFHGQSVMQLTETTFAHYDQRDWKTSIHGDDPQITCANQHNETDYNHLHRRWEALGWHYWYEHRADGHTLWLADNSTLADMIATASGEGAMHFHSESGSMEDDGLQQWQAVRRLGSGQLTLASFDYKNPQPHLASGYSLNRQGDVFAHELYENTGAYGYKNIDEGESLAQRRMEESDHLRQYFEAAGNHRGAQPGLCFRLDGHFSAEEKRCQPGQERPDNIAEREYLILSVVHSASNNYQLGPGTPSHYVNKLVCVRRDIRWRPGRGHNSTPCVVAGVQTALVVGPAGEEIHTDALGRIRLQFHWDRLGEFDERSSPWIRVMMPMAGPQMGHIALPRVGQEVVVQFQDGNIDHPIVIGVVYNSANPPPWQLPQQRALSGLRSRELGARSANHLVLDDTKGAIQAQLRSEHQDSRLSLGNITRIDDNAGRKEARGVGFELASNAWGALRAAKGMLITTETPTGGGSVKQLDETQARLAQARQLQQGLASMAVDAGAQDSAAQQGAVAESIQRQNAAIKGSAGDFPELSEPHLLLASPAGIELSTAQSIHLAASEHVALTSSKNISLASGDSLFASIARTFSLFVHKAGMKLIAASGKVSIQAHSDEVEILAQKVLSLISEADWVNIKGKKGVRLHGANHMLEISDKVQFFTSSPVLFNGNLETMAPKSVSQEFNERPHSSFDQEVLLVNADDTPAVGIAFEILRDDGNVAGKSSDDGSTNLQKSTGTDSYVIRYKGELP